MTFETNDNYSIRFKISNNSSTIRFDLKRKNTIRTALVVTQPAVSLAQNRESSPARTGGLIAMLCHQLMHVCISKRESIADATVSARQSCHLANTFEVDAIRVAPNLTFSNSAEAEFGRISELKFGRSRIWLKLVFLVREQYASDKTNGVNNAVSRYRDSTLQCFLCCVTVCQLLIKCVE